MLESFSLEMDMILVDFNMCGMMLVLKSKCV